MDDQRNYAEEAYNRNIQRTGDGEISVEEAELLEKLSDEGAITKLNDDDLVWLDKFVHAEIIRRHQRPWYVHRMYIEQRYGGPEEGDWWFDQKWPIHERMGDFVPPMEFRSEDEANEACQLLTSWEYIRRDKEARYGYTSVVSYKDGNFYAFEVAREPVIDQIPKHKPHYE